MGLVGYSESESSEDETTVQVSKQGKPSTTTKPGFQKFTDGENRHKIKVSLPASSLGNGDTVDDGEPAPKRAKVTGGGFNAMLPAPKRSKPALSTSGRGKGLGSGINLKTGAAPGFSREVPYISNGESEAGLGNDAGIDEGQPSIDASSTQDAEAPIPEPPKPTGNAMRFKPLSVSRKPKKKLAAVFMPAMSSTSPPAPKQIPSKPKVSLFSTPLTDDSVLEVATGDYKPMIYNAASETDLTVEGDNELPESSYTSDNPTSSQNSINQPQSLSTIADSLNLSASQRRQLLGRKGANIAGANVVEFNTETEYAANEELRARGETTTFNAVRSVASGKHSLQQLVNLVSNQKEALEESFAAGKRNKKEAGSKYGW